MGEQHRFANSPFDPQLAAVVEEIFAGAANWPTDEELPVLQDAAPDDPISQTTDADHERAELQALYEAPSAQRNDEDAVLEAEREVYAHSMRLVRKIGEAAVTGATDAEIAEMIASLKGDFESSIVEMLQTDAEFRRMLEVTREREHAISNGKVMVRRGEIDEPITDMLERGLIASQKAAKADPRMRVQANRDAADLRNGHAVDAMPVRTLHMTLAMDPKKAMAADPAFWRQMGYREGLAFLQCYYKVDEYTLVSFAYSVDYSDLAKWRATWAANGGNIPVEVSADTCLDYAISLPCASLAEARARVASVRRGYYQMHGLPAPVRSVDEFKAANQRSIDDVFYNLYLRLTPAQYSGGMDGALQALARSLLNQSASLNKESKAQLARLCASGSIDDEGVRFLENAIRYGLVEHLRDGLGCFAGGQAAVLAPLIVPGGGLFALQLAGNIASGVARGTAAGRTYGGCTKMMDISAEKGDDDGNGSSARNPQDVYGGRVGDGSSGESSGVCMIETTNCYCCAYNNDGTDRGSKLTVMAKIDTRETIHCLRPGCGAWMSKGGKAKFKGYIAARAEMLAADVRSGEDDNPAEPIEATARISQQQSSEAAYDAVPAATAGVVDDEAGGDLIINRPPRSRGGVGLAA